MARKVAMIRAPFRGILPSHSPRVVPADFASDANGVHTRYGTIDKRPGYDAYLQSGLLNRIPYVRSVFLDDTRLYTFENSGKHKLVDSSGALVGGGSTFTQQPTDTARVPQVLTTNIFPSNLSGPILYIIQGRMGSAGACRKLFNQSGTWYAQPFGITAPTLGVTGTDAAVAGGVTGNYSYRYTYYNDKTGTESGPSPIAGNTTIAASQMRIDFTGAESSDSQVTHFRLYRKKNAVGGAADQDETWFFVTNIGHGIGVVYIDNNADGSFPKNLENQIVNDDTVPSDLVTYCAAVHGDRMFFGDESSNVYWSEPDEPEKISGLSYTGVRSPHGDGVVALASTGGVLWIFKQFSIWYMTGTSPETFQFVKHAEGVGCVYRDSLVQIGGDLYFCSHRGPMRLRGGSLEFIGAPVERDWRLNVPSDLSYAEMQAEWEPVTNSYVVCTPAGTSSNPASNPYSTQFVFQLDSQAWTLWNINGARGASLHFRGTQPPYMYVTAPGGGGTFDIVEFGLAEDDNGSDVAFYWTTGKLDFGTHMRKIVHNATLLFSSVSSEDLTLHYAIDDGAFVSAGTVAANTNPGQRLFNLNQSAVSYVRFKISGSKSVPCRIVGLDVDYEVADHR